MKKYISCDILIVGGGIVGSSIARSIAIKCPSKKIILIEKDNEIGQHNSVLNSGVIHSGLYYPKNSLRKEYCIRGNNLLTQFHKDKNIPLRNCGKLIAPRNVNECEGIFDLYKQGRENGVELELINLNEAMKIEPNLKVNGDFPIIFSPNTKVGNPKKVMHEIEKDMRGIANLEILCNTKIEKLLKLSDNEILISTGNHRHNIECGYFINAAGLYSDKIAKMFNKGLQYELLPIIGTYLVDILSEKNKSHDIIYNDVDGTKILKTLVYPIPPIKGNNFLGVHTTITSNGTIKIGPTALPCLWREQHLGLNSLNIEEFIEIISLYIKLLKSENRNSIISLIKKQVKNLLTHNIILEGKSLVGIYDKVETNIYRSLKHDRFKFKIGGIRSQLVNINSMKFENDFIIDKGKNHIHLLNIISPGWTSAMAIAEDIII